MIIHMINQKWRMEHLCNRFLVAQSNDRTNRCFCFAALRKKATVRSKKTVFPSLSFFWHFTNILGIFDFFPVTKLVTFRVFHWSFCLFTFICDYILKVVVSDISEWMHWFLISLSSNKYIMSGVSHSGVS